MGVSFVGVSGMLEAERCSFNSALASFAIFGDIRCRPLDTFLAGKVV